MTEPATSVRLDIWLWAARFFKTRSLARQAIDGGKIDIGGATAKPARLVHAGDRLRVTRGEERFEVLVLALSTQRGPAPVARGLYAETEASSRERDRVREMRRLAGAGVAHPQGRPDKHSRKLLRGIKEWRDQEPGAD